MYIICKKYKEFYEKMTVVICWLRNFNHRLHNQRFFMTQITNADNFDYDKTVVKTTSAKSNYLNLLKKDLSGSYTIGTASADLNPSEANYQAIVIVGKN